VNTDAPSGSLIVSRTSPNDIGMRDLYVLVDDREEQTLLNGQTLSLPLEPGKHTLKVTNRLFTQKADFSLESGQTAKFIASNRALGGLFSFLIVLGGTGAYKVTLEPA
jgi:hypothetical protein